MNPSQFAKSKVRSSFLLAALLLLQALPADAVAQESAIAAEVPASAALRPSVEVSGMRDPQFIPYSVLHASVERFYKLPDRDQLQLILRVVPKRPDVDLTQLRARLEGEDYRLDLRVSPGGRLEVPHDPRALASDAHFLFNVRSGSLQPEINVLVRLQGLSHRYADLMKALQQADTAERALMSRTQRLMFPRSNALALGLGSGSSATVLVEGLRSGPLTLRTNAKGAIPVPKDDDWAADNPLLHFSHAPDWVIASILPERGRNLNP